MLQLRYLWNIWTTSIYVFDNIQRYPWSIFISWLLVYLWIYIYIFMRYLCKYINAFNNYVWLTMSNLWIFMKNLWIMKYLWIFMKYLCICKKHLWMFVKYLWIFKKYLWIFMKYLWIYMKYLWIFMKNLWKLTRSFKYQFLTLKYPWIYDISMDIHDIDTPMNLHVRYLWQCNRSFKYQYLSLKYLWICDTSMDSMIYLWIYMWDIYGLCMFCCFIWTVHLFWASDRPIEALIELDILVIYAPSHKPGNTDVKGKLCTMHLLWHYGQGNKWNIQVEV